MEMRHLRYFAALAEELHFTRAAEQVHVTQSTLSHQIRQLEAELGHRLFDRIGRRVFLTQDGLRFLERVKRALAEIDSGVLSLKAPEPASAVRITVAATTTLSEALVPGCVCDFLEQAPAASVAMEIRTPEEIRKALLEERVDIGVAYPPLDTTGLWFEPLFEERSMVVVREGHPLAQRRKIRLVDLHGQRVVLPAQTFSLRQIYDGYLRSANAQPNVVIDGIGSFSALRLLLSRLDLAAILPESVCPREPGLRLIPIVGAAPTRMPSIYLKHDRKLPEPARMLVETIKRHGAAYAKARGPS